MRPQTGDRIDQPAKWMNRRYRLTSSIDFKRVRRAGKSYAHPLAILVASPSDLPCSRFGVTAGRSVGGAVQRNRAKRLLREALRAHLPAVAPGWDVVLVARPALVDAEWPDIRNAIARLLSRAQLIETNDRAA